MKKILLFLIAISTISIFYTASFAAGTPKPVQKTPVVNATPIPTDPDKGADNGIFSLASNISNMVDNIKTFFEDGVGGVMEKSLGDIFQSFVDATAIDGKWVFSTPTLVQSDWVRTLWWIMLFISIGSIGIGMGITMLRIISGKYKGHLKTALLSFMMSAVLVSFSLLIADKMIIFGNDLINSYARSTLAEEVKKPENQSIMIIKDIDYKKIGFEYLDGKSLVNLSFGSKLGNPEPMYKQFLTKNGGGGAVILVWAMTVIALIGIFGTLRQLVIGAINGLGPLWISISAWTGNMKPVYGYLNLNLRCIALSYVFDFTWMICMYVSNHSGDFSVGKQLFATIMFTIALVTAYFLFGYWVYQAARSPIDLAGGLVQEQAIKKLSSIYPVAGAILSRLGMDNSKDSEESPGTGADTDKINTDDPLPKDRLSSAEQIAARNPTNANDNEQIANEQVAATAAGTNTDIQNKSSTTSITSSDGAKYDPSLGRPVKVSDRLLQASQSSYTSHELTGKGKTLSLEGHLNNYRLHNMVNSTADDITRKNGYSVLDTKTNDNQTMDQQKPREINSGIHQILSNQNNVKDVLKQVSAKPIKQPVKLNGDKILNTTNKGGDKK